MFRTLRTTSTPNVRPYDNDHDIVRNDLNTLRYDLHELCTKTMTNFDCNRFLLPNDFTNNRTGARDGGNNLNTSMFDNKKNKTDLLVESVPLRNVRVTNNRYGECTG
jgi:hypothetical protein